MKQSVTKWRNNAGEPVLVKVRNKLNHTYRKLATRQFNCQKYFSGSVILVFGSVIYVFRSVIYVFGSVILVFGSVIYVFRSVLYVLGSVILVFVSVI